MQCRLCGFEFDEDKVPNRGCTNCGKPVCNLIHCPNCGFANSPHYEEEFEFVTKLKNKFKNRKKNNFFNYFSISFFLSFN